MDGRYHTDVRTDPCEHRYDAVDVPCLFGSSAQIRVASWLNLVAPIVGARTIFSPSLGPGPVSSRWATIRRAFAASYAISGGGSHVFGAKVFGDELLVLSSVTESPGLGMLVITAMILMVMIIVTFLWSTPWGMVLIVERPHPTALHL